LAEGDTIFALSSGSPPAAIAVVRISGPEAGAAMAILAGRLPEPRHASLGTLRDPQSGELLDRALLLWFPGPRSSTGEDLAELHLHGGRSVVAGVLAALSGLAGLRAAEPGEFTRRAFQNGRIDLAEAEGLSDLLTAETQSQRRAALMLAGGALGRTVEGWQTHLLGLSAQLEAVLDFSDEGDVEEQIPAGWTDALTSLTSEIGAALARPTAERLREGIKVVIAGPPNAGKSTLLNALAGRDAAITSSMAGTTRDLVEAPTAIGGVPFLLVDTAGLREGEDEIEAIGVERAQQSLAAADLVLWLGEPDDCPATDAIRVQPKSDLSKDAGRGDIAVSAKTGAGMEGLVRLLTERAKRLLPAEGDVALNARHSAILRECLSSLEAAAAAGNPLIASEELRLARGSLDRITGRGGVEHMLDALFGSFCIGK
jgi:tRNA modification GTPase